MRPLLFMILIYVTISFISGCDNATDSGTNDTFPASNLSYSEHIQPIFITYCGVIECHDSYTRAHDLDLTSYYGLSSAHAGIIVKKNANSSILVQRIVGSIQPQMPLYRPPLSPNKIQAIKTWINEGANNN